MSDIHFFFRLFLVFLLLQFPTDCMWKLTYAQFSLKLLYAWQQLLLPLGLLEHYK